MRELEKSKTKKNKKRGREDEDEENMNIKNAAMAFGGGFAGMGMQQQVGSMGGGEGGGLLDRLQASQRRLLAAEGGVSSVMPNVGEKAPQIEAKGRCIPGKVDLPGLVVQVNAAATQLAHRGMIGNSVAQHQSVDPSKYGDPNIMPVVLVSQNGDVQFLMTIDGITCAHCVKIVEAVLKGCQGRIGGSPIDGLLDASADRELNAIVIKIDKISEARRIAHESARNLSMVGYEAKAKSINIQTVGGLKAEEGEEMSLLKMAAVFEAVPYVNPQLGEVLNWNSECRCPDNNISRVNCPRYVHCCFVGHIEVILCLTHSLLYLGTPK
jgi:copper chaperone CopZ